MKTSPELREFVASIPFIDTHSHVAGFDFGTPLDDRGGKSLPQLLLNDYLLYMSGSCHDASLEPAGGGAWKVEDAESHFRAILPLIDRYRALTTWATFREGIRWLHPFSEPDIGLNNWHAINESVVRAYRTHGERAWHRATCAAARIVKQNQMVVLPYVTDHWDGLPAKERQLQADLILPSLVLDGYLFTGFASGAPGRERSKELLGVDPRTHGEYLDFVGRAMDLFKQKGGWSVKLLTNYHRTLFFEEVPDSEAVSLFAMGPEKLKADPARAGEFRRLQDNLCWHMLEMARDRGLPLIVHTGYSLPSSWGDPENMHNLFRSRRLAGLKIDLCHSGWPHEGGTMLMARTYRNCYFNICWTPMLSASLGRRVLEECIDMVPMNKILAGIDAGSIEHMMGVAEFMRSELCWVLEKKMSDGQFDLAVAQRVAQAILYDNAREFYAFAF